MHIAWRKVWIGPIDRIVLGTLHDRRLKNIVHVTTVYISAQKSAAVHCLYICHVIGRFVQNAVTWRPVINLWKRTEPQVNGNLCTGMELTAWQLPVVDVGLVGWSRCCCCVVDSCRMLEGKYWWSNPADCWYKEWADWTLSPCGTAVPWALAPLLSAMSCPPATESILPSLAYMSTVMPRGTWRPRLPWGTLCAWCTWWICSTPSLDMLPLRLSQSLATLSFWYSLSLSYNGVIPPGELLNMWCL